MIDFSPLYQAMDQHGLDTWRAILPGQLADILSADRNGHYQQWQQVLDSLPELTPSTLLLNADTITVGQRTDVSDSQWDVINTALRGFIPWRKGPFELFGIHIDTEWRSDWKWQRLQSHIQPLSGRRVLDVGCGSGYHCWRMAGEGARLVIGIDPSLLFFFQFQAVNHFVRSSSAFHLPLALEALPARLEAFDTVFSMGVLYHRRSPIDHILALSECLCSGGELVLETLVVDGPAGYALLPDDRYAMMRNVWFIPSCDTLCQWMRRAGLADVRVVDVSTTTTAEQRATEWMRFQSLADFLDPTDPTLTAEGYPAPKRAVVLARKP